MRRHAAFLLFCQGDVNAVEVVAREDLYLLRSPDTSSAVSTAYAVGKSIESINRSYADTDLEEGYPSPVGYATFTFIGLRELVEVPDLIEDGTIIHESTTREFDSVSDEVAQDRADLQAFCPAGPGISETHKEAYNVSEWMWAKWYLGTEVYVANRELAGPGQELRRYVMRMTRAKSPNEAHDRAIQRALSEPDPMWRFLGLRTLHLVSEPLDRDEVELQCSEWREEKPKLVAMVKVFDQTQADRPDGQS